MTNSEICRRRKLKSRIGCAFRKRAVVGSIVLLTMFMISAILRADVAHAADTNNDLEFRVDFSSVREMYEGSYLPVKITAASYGENYSGWVDLTVCSVAESYLLYSEHMDITAGQSHTALFAFPVHIGPNMRILLQFRSDSGEILYSRFYSFSVSLRGATRSELVLGLVGQAPLSAASRFEIPDQNRESLLCDVQPYLVDPQSVTADIRSLLCYDILYLSDDYLDVYSPEVIRNLINWASNGGILVVGGVVDRNRQQRLEQLLLDTVKQRDFTNYSKIAGKYFLIGDGIVYTFDYDYFSGYVFFNNQVRSMLQSALYNLPVRISERVLDMKEVSDYQEEIFEQLPAWRFGFPSFRRYIWILLIYIFLALPAGYLLLRRIRKHYYLQGTVVLLAVAFAVLIYVMGAKSRMSLPYSSLLSIEESYGDMKTVQHYLALQTLYDKKASFHLRGEDAFRLLTSGNPESEGTVNWDHKPDLSAYSMESYNSENDLNVVVGKRQSGLFRFLSNELTDLPDVQNETPDFTLELTDGVPKGADRSLFADDLKNFDENLQAFILRADPDAKCESSTVSMLASHLKAHQYRFDQGTYLIEVFSGEGEDTAIVTREREMIKSSYIRIRITEK